MEDVRKISFEEAMAILDRHAAEDEANKMETLPKKKNVSKVKDLLKEGAKQGRGGLNKGAKRQLDLLDEEGY